ncbi:MAG: hypothetical protein ACLFRY_03510, partial [Spirochaetia bacterium]
IALYLYPAKGDYSGPDLLPGGRFIPQGEEESFFLYFEEEASSCRFDLLAVDTEGYQYRLHELEASIEKPVTVKFTVRHHVPLPPPVDTVDIVVKNSIVPIFFLFMRPPESGWWGASILGPQDMLVSGQTLTLSVPSLGAAVPYEILAVDEDFDEYLLEVAVDPVYADRKGPEVLIRLDDLKERQ